MIRMSLFRSFGFTAFSALLFFPPCVNSQPAMELEPGVNIFIPSGATSQPALEPGASPYGTLGMSQVISAEPMGAGRLTLQLRGNFYQQDAASTGTQVHGTQITSATGAAALGMNSYMNIFASLGAYNLQNTPVKAGSGLGTTTLGFQGSIPLSLTFPAYLGLQVATLLGTARSKIDTIRADGYDYFETRTYTDVLARLSQSLLFNGRDMSLRFHFNEGFVSSFEPGKEVLIIAGFGTEFVPFPPLILGLEVNGRSFLKKPLNTDPLWITPSLVYRTPVHLNLQVGSDFSFSRNRPSQVRALEPWRIFGSLTFSYDLQAQAGREKDQQCRMDSLARLELAKQVRSDRLANDSLQMLAAMERARQKAIDDFLAEKLRKDSLALVNTQRILEEERSKRSMEEKQLLSTGLLLLDAVYFETGKTEISINSKPYLNIIAKMLTKYPKLQIEVEGHTDNVGGFDNNMRLSQRRADEVMRYMEMMAPELQGRLSAKGYGYTQPKADNKTAEGRKLNRRTELQVLNKDVLKEYNP